MIKHSKIEHLVEYAEHLKSLSHEDRYTRFGHNISDTSIDNIILNILYHQNDHHIFVYFKQEQIIGFGHLTREGKDWELAVSVDHIYQGQGIAKELMSYMIDWGKVHGVTAVFMHCISNNKRIQHLAQKFGLKTIDRSAGEVTAQVQLPKPTVLDYTNVFVREQTELATDIVRLQRAWISNFNPLKTKTATDH